MRMNGTHKNKHGSSGKGAAKSGAMYVAGKTNKNDSMSASKGTKKTVLKGSKY